MRDSGVGVRGISRGYFASEEVKRLAGKSYRTSRLVLIEQNQYRTSSYAAGMPRKLYFKNQYQRVAISHVFLEKTDP